MSKFKIGDTVEYLGDCQYLTRNRTYDVDGVIDEVGLITVIDDNDVITLFSEHFFTLVNGNKKQPNDRDEFLAFFRKYGINIETDPYLVKKGILINVHSNNSFVGFEFDDQGNYKGEITSGDNA